MPSILTAWLLLALAGPHRLPTADTRAGIVAVYRLVLSTNDLDGDGRLSRAEVAAMVTREFSAVESGSAADMEQARRGMLSIYEDLDRDHDGYLTYAELMREPLAFFACADRNRDGRLTNSEIARAMSVCPSHEIRMDFDSPSASAAR